MEWIRKTSDLPLPQLKKNKKDYLKHPSKIPHTMFLYKLCLQWKNNQYIQKYTHVICPSRVILRQKRNYQRMEHLQQTYQATITWVQLSPGKMSCTFLMYLIFEYLSPWSEKILALSFLWVNFVTRIIFVKSW